MISGLPIGTIRPDNGYFIVKLPDHPLAYRGWVKRHRLVYFEAVRGQEQYCILCDWGPLPWLGGWRYAINIDHVNEVKGDDRLENLQPLCYWCNLFKSGWPLTDTEHADAIEQWCDTHPAQRPNPSKLLIDMWGLGPADVHYNLELNRNTRAN
jgi:hypothetical protein